MDISVLTLFPKMFEAVTCESIIKRAQSSGKIKIRLYNMRDYTLDKNRKVDDKPFGGGPGMVIRCQPVESALIAAKKKTKGAKVILMSPKGRQFSHKTAYRLSKLKSIILITGHYEGVDERITDLVDEEISIGDYILTGGELPAMVLIDSVARLIPGVLGDDASSGDETFSSGLLEYPHYTRPADYNGKKVPEVLISGNHKSVKKWRDYQSLRATIKLRPDLIKHIDQLDNE
ncbi:tRNA (guanosine(37)-N1)-methyltransferase TrmD [Candidatus Omnitrophota bacterium]